ncbi:MAG TPA: hypothetical protein VKY40_07825 [Halanaerobiales bacterium]|nr:hypothetical protein [Halanaerobiales bacterium]
MVSEEGSYIIEFVGIAGVGKTTIRDQLLIILRKKTDQISTFSGAKLDWKQKIDLRLFFKSIEALFRIKHDFIPVKRLYKNWRYFYANQIKLKYYSKMPGIHLSDQGIFQVIGTMRKHSRNNRINFWNHKNISGLYLPDLLVIVKAGSEIISDRQYFRDKKRPTAEFLKNANIRVQKTVTDAAYIKRKAPFFDYLVVHNNSREDLEGICQVIMDKIEDDRVHK